jgi:hypothetical protein
MNRLITAIFTSVIFASANAALAQPFRTDPASFASYLNQKNWKDGKRRTFSNLRGCKYFDLRPNIDDRFLQSMACEYAYVTIDDPIRGRIFCELMPVNEVLRGMFWWNEASWAVWWGEQRLLGGGAGREEVWGHGKLKVCKSV